MIKRAMRQGFSLALALFTAIFLLACVGPAGPASAQSRAAAQTSPALVNDRLSCWIADWDLARGLAEWRAHPGLFDTVRVFAAYFDEAGKPALAPAGKTGQGARIELADKGEDSDFENF